MNLEDALKKIGEIGIVPVVRAATYQEAQQAVEAICAGGIPIVEITMTVPNAIGVIREVVRQYGDRILTGAGTVLNYEQAAECFDSGAEFLVSPGLSIPVLHAAQKHGKLAIPGALTPSEIMAAMREGARAIKIFPCGNLGGPKYIKALKAPFPQVHLIPTGGVNLQNAADYIAAGAYALGAGADLVDLKALRQGLHQQVRETAQNLVHVIDIARKEKSASSGALQA